MIFPRVERDPEPWCRYSGTCYKKGWEYHLAHPEPTSGSNLKPRPYWEGCPGDEDRCEDAMCLMGRRRFGCFKEDEKIRENYRHCEICGKPFLPSNSQNIYCSKECVKEAKRRSNRANAKRKARSRRKCPVCGKTFDPHVNNQVYCSKECSDQRNRTRALEYYRSHR